MGIDSIFLISKCIEDYFYLQFQNKSADVNLSFQIHYKGTFLG